MLHIYTDMKMITLQRAEFKDILKIKVKNMMQQASPLCGNFNCS